MDKREWKKLCRVHNLLKDFEPRIKEAAEDDDKDIRDLFDDVRKADNLVTEIVERYEDQ